MNRFLTLLLLAAAVDVAQAQTVDLVVHVADPSGKPVAGAVAVAVPLGSPLRLPARPKDEVIGQVDKEFQPRVKVVLVGTAVAFPNHDAVRHHVYSFSPAKRFELPLYAGVPVQPVVFDKPGIVVLGCNIHDWMVAYVYVSESPHYAQTGVEGRMTIAGLPPRQYSVRVWHPQMEDDEEGTRRSLDLSHGRRAEASWTLRLKPEAKVRRAPAMQRGGGY